MRLFQVLEANAAVDADIRKRAYSLFSDIVVRLDSMPSSRFVDVLIDVDNATFQHTVGAAMRYPIDVPRLLGRHDEETDFVLLMKLDSPMARGAFMRNPFSQQVGRERLILINIQGRKRTVNYVDDELKRDHDMSFHEFMANPSPPEVHKDVVVEVLSQEEDTFMHEYIHLYDDIRSHGYVSGEKGGVKNPLNNASGYVNSPSEFNAHFQAAMHTFRQHMYGSGPEGRDNHINDWSRILNSFDAFKQMFMTYLPDYFAEHMNSDTERRLNKRMYQTWKHLQQTMGRQQT